MRSLPANSVENKACRRGGSCGAPYHVIVSTFGPESPTKCGGLDVVRYDAESLHRWVWRAFPPVGELQRITSQTVCDNPAVPLLLLQGRTDRSL